MFRKIIYFSVYIVLDLHITYRNASVFCQSECAVNMVDCYRKVRALIQMYRVLPITKREYIAYACYNICKSERVHSQWKS